MMLMDYLRERGWNKNPLGMYNYINDLEYWLEREEELINNKYQLDSFWLDIQRYIRWCDICQGSHDYNLTSHDHNDNLKIYREFDYVIKNICKELCR